jgi:diguanylate cyclase (GGDEF)-like protein/PAS domain S-box-containing protein
MGTMDYKAMLDKFADLGLFIQDLKNDKAYPNFLWKEMGYTEEDMTRFGFLNFVHPQDRDRVDKAVREFQSSDGALSQFTFRIIDKKKKWHWLVSSCIAVERDEEGRIMTYVGFDHDITEEIEARKNAEKALREAETLRSANAIIVSHLELPDIISSVLEQAERVISFNSASVQLTSHDKTHPRMEIVGGRGFPEDFQYMGIKFPIDSQTPNARILESREALVLDRKGIEHYKAFSRYAYGEIQCWMGIPLIYGGRLLGMIAFDRLLDQPFDNDDLRLGLAFADQVAIALENARLFEETRKLAITDSLTGCYTRRWMFSELDKEMELASRQKHELSLIMFDIDDFKLVNDSYGHLTGDQVLKKVTKLADQILRKTDTLCRSGGEEFVIILPYVDIDAAFQVAERIRNSVEEDSRVSCMQKPVTISLGCVEFQKGDRESIDVFLSRVDRAMYKSKRDGKNRTSRL